MHKVSRISCVNSRNFTRSLELFCYKKSTKFLSTENPEISAEKRAGNSNVKNLNLSPQARENSNFYSSEWENLNLDSSGPKNSNLKSETRENSNLNLKWRENPNVNSKKLEDSNLDAKARGNSISNVKTPENSFFNLKARENSKLPKSGPSLHDFMVPPPLDSPLPPILDSAHPYLPPVEVRAQKVFFDVYGCQMNVSDTEIIYSILSSAGYKRTLELEEADVVLVITCAIRDGAEQKIWGRLASLNDLRRRRQRMGSRPVRVGLLGCMAERLKKRILEESKYVDLVAGPDAYRDLPRLLAVTEENQTAINVALSFDETYADINPVRLNGAAKSAFVTIMRGCDNMCTYCIVPFVRGRERSRPIGSILEEVRILADSGVKEVTLLGQNVNSYRDMSEMTFVGAWLEKGAGKEEVSSLEAGQSVEKGAGQRAGIEAGLKRRVEKNKIKEAESGQGAELIEGSKVEQIMEKGMEFAKRFEAEKNNEKAESRVEAGLKVEKGAGSEKRVGLKVEAGAERKTELAKGFKTVYKTKLGGRRFADLLEKVAEVDPEMRVRFTSPHPKDFPDEVLQLIASKPNICKQIHLPAQSGNSAVLERMRRGYTRESYLELVQHIRELIPDIHLSSDFIAGFCGETDAEFNDTISLMEEVEYNMAYLFHYSMREKTTAHRRFQDDVPLEVKLERVRRMSNLFRSQAEKLNSRLVGTQQLVLVEGASRRSEETLQGRTDGNTRVLFPNVEVPDEFQEPRKIVPGDYVVVKIRASNSNSLTGNPVCHSSIFGFERT